MSATPSVSFVPLDREAKGTLVVLAGEAGALPPSLDAEAAKLAARAASLAKFKGKSFAAVETLAPDGASFDRLLLVGTRSEGSAEADHWLRVGGVVAARAGNGADATVRCELADGGPLSADDCADMALGALLRAYRFDRYKSKKGKDAAEDAEKGKAPSALIFAVADPAAAEAAFAARQAVADGVVLARDLVNEPANVLTTTEYTARIEALGEVGLEVETLGEAEMRERGMLALLGVAQGSPTPPRLCIMRWNGGREGDAPVAFVGKGVVFDTGGVSIKPGAGMEDMKGDMGGSAAVVGLMRALAGRKAAVNAVGVVGLVENAVDGNEQRPGDIVRAMSGTTIEVINTDAEGRLVLADALWYTQERFAPRIMINLATLTGAIIVALGHHHAGLFSNNDELAGHLAAAGLATGEKVWRMPLGKDYDKQIESKFADIKNVGQGRQAGSIAAAQFLQRFVNEVPWAHLDIAGTAMASPANEYNQSWASGFGVRLLDRLVADHYEGR